MTPCPSDETLASLLAEALSIAERDAISEHIEKCVACVEKLARLTELSESESWRRSAHPDTPSDTEQSVVSRLKLARHSFAPYLPDPADTPTIDSAHGRFADAATIDFEIPSVPG